MRHATDRTGPKTTAGTITRTIGATMAAVLCLAALTGCAEEHSGVLVDNEYCVGRKSNAQYDWPWYDSLNELEQASDIVVYVMITGCAAPSGTGGDTDTAGYDTAINAVVLGGASSDDEKRTDRIDPPPTGETIVIRGYTAEGSGAGRLTVGERYVFFLGVGAEESGGYYEMTPALSVFPVTGSTAKEPSGSRNADGSFALTGSLVARLGITDKAE